MGIDVSAVKGVVMDMDGVLWRGDTPLPGLHEWIALLRARGIPFALATNNSRLTQLDYVHKLEHLGVKDVSEAQIITSGTTTVDYIKRRYAAGSLIHVLGGDGLRADLRRAGYTVTGELDPNVRAVTVGLDFELTYDKLKWASLCLQAGADFIATNSDATFPMGDGLVPGAGSIVAALQTASGREPLVMGKPHPPMFAAAIGVLETKREHTLMIGDRLDTDIAGAKAAGLMTALVLTGVSTREQAAAAAVPPDAIYEGLPEMIAAWE